MTHNSLTCRELVDFLQSYLDGELPAAERAAFEAHLAICPDCVEYLDNYRQAVALGRACCDEPCPDLPERLVQAVLDSLRAGEQPG